MYGKKGNTSVNINVTNKFSLLALDNSDKETDDKETDDKESVDKEPVDKDSELSMINNYYKNTKKEPFIKQNYYKKQNINNDLSNDFTFISNKRKDKNQKNLEIINISDNVLEETLSNYYRVLGHHNEDKSWDYISYYNITTLNKWLDVSSFLNTLNNVKGECSFIDFDIFIMKNEISPMWEDLENRNGSICSIKIYSLKDGYEILKKLLINICNNTLLNFSTDTWNTINGISFSPKKIDNSKDDNYCVIIKLWFKINFMILGSIEKYINPDINELIKKYSIKVKAIKPEY